VRIVLGCLDDAQIGFARNSDEDTAYLEILLRLSRRINKERERLRTKVKTITLDMSSKIATEGTKLASVAIVDDRKFEDLNKQSEINVRKHYEKAGQDFESAIENAIQSIQLEVEAELQSNLTEAFVARLNFNGQFSKQNSVGGFSKQQVQGQVAWLQKIGGQVGANITKAATREFAATAGQGFLRSMDVAGSSLHQGVYSVGKLIGFKFKPWQAVGIAKNIGNAAVFLGPALAVVSIGMDLHAMQKEREYEKQMADVRRDITSQFRAIAIDLEKQIEEQLREFETQVYGQLEQNITEARQQTQEAMSASHEELRQIAAIRADLETILRDVQRAATPSVL